MASNMYFSFGSIRHLLMVGIGGGVPSKSEDIWLGDMVVGVPTPRIRRRCTIRLRQNHPGGAIRANGDIEQVINGPPNGGELFTSGILLQRQPNIDHHVGDVSETPTNDTAPPIPRPAQGIPF
ncbi:hypothetical protein ETB97_004215 [Aspergillus alliaceus]|uniref:Uncharacterized protein n=1 Tax=Petromyces alliaceus TaxID=209559 RepID=A0A8H6EB58_PETAA|nr:hypothetical protein ETB97_004215 [Aspergillus burnettii]